MHVAQNARVFCDMHKNKDLERVAWLHLNAMRFMFGTRAQGLFQRQMDFREQSVGATSRGLLRYFSNITLSRIARPDCGSQVA